MASSLVSIIIAVYNGEKYIHKCLNSIKNQSYKNFEVILVDDGSTDSSGVICDSFAEIDDRFKVIHKSNSGCSAARNIGLKEACGEYIGIVDQDDCLSVDYIEYFMNLIHEYNVPIATSLFIQNFIGEELPTNDCANDKIELWSGIEAAEAMLMYILQIGPWNKLIKKSLLIENSITFKEDFYCGEGFAFSIECFQNSSYVAVGKKRVYYYRIDNNSSGSSTFSINKYNSSIRAQQYMRNILIDKSEYADDILKFSLWKTISDYFTLLVVSGEKKKYFNEYKEMKKEIKKNASKAFKLPTTKKQKIRALMFIINPSVAIYLLKKRINKTTGGKYR